MDADPQVIDVAAATRVAMVDGLDAVAVGVEQERSVVIRAIGGSLTRPSGVLAAGVDTGAPERVNVLARRGDEAWGFMLIALTGLLVSPVSWTHHWTIAVAGVWLLVVESWFQT